MRRPTASRLVPVAFVALLTGAAFALAGCTGDASPENRALSLVEAYQAVYGDVRALAPSAHLVGFVGHEGPAPNFLRGLLGDHVVPVDTSYDAQRGDGRAYVWRLLFASIDGGLVTATVQSATGQVETRWAERNADPLLQTLWGLNLGGRLTVDSPAALQAVLEEDAAILRHVRDHPTMNVVYASTIRDIDGRESQDLVYEVFYDHRQGSSRPYAFYAHVSHFSGKFVDSGDYLQGIQERTVRLIERQFSLGPTPQEVFSGYMLDQKIFSTRMALAVRGSGTFVVEILRDNETAVARVEDRLINDADDYDLALGTLGSAEYVLHVTSNGSLSFDLAVDGVIVL